jgi:hypothetical protein
MTYIPERRVNATVKFRVEHYSKRLEAWEVSRFDSEKTAREYYAEKLEDGKRPKLFREISTVELEEIVQ